MTSRLREKVLYVETTSDEAINIIENLTLVSSAKRMLEVSTLTYKEKSEIVQGLCDLERSLRNRLRKEVLEPDPVQVSKQLIRRIENEIRKETV